MYPFTLLTTLRGLRRRHLQLALKILQKDTVVELRQERNISRERRITATLQHANVLRLYGTFQDADCLFMMLEVRKEGNE